MNRENKLYYIIWIDKVNIYIKKKHYQGTKLLTVMFKNIFNISYKCPVGMYRETLSICITKQQNLGLPKMQLRTFFTVLIKLCMNNIIFYYFVMISF